MAPGCPGRPGGRGGPGGGVAGRAPPRMLRGRRWGRATEEYRDVKVGCIGLGDIAQKAYLPVLTTQAGTELHLQTRSPATLARVGDQFHIPAAQRHSDLDALLAQGLDAAFVHAPTTVHPEIVTRLLEAGVATYVDKPLAYELADAERLVKLAEERGVSLAVGFNRRY